jgi:hypothetical protein
MTLGLFMLRASQLGLSTTDLDNLEYGTIVDMMTEASNDSCEYRQIASQDDFDRF